MTTRYEFPSRVALDPTLNTVVKDGVGYIYALDDTTFSNPLVLFDKNGHVKADVRTTYDGVTEEFFVDDNDIVWWSSGPYAFMIVSFTGLRDAAMTAMAAAVDARLAAQTAQAAAEAAAAGSGGGGPLPDTVVIKHETIATAGTDASYRSLDLDYMPTTTSPDTSRITVQGNVTQWTNEWGGLRGTPTSEFKDDSLVRGVRRTDIGAASTGNWIEYEDRSFDAADPRRKPWGVRWRDGVINRNGIDMALCYVRYGVTSLPPNLPDGTVIVTVND